MRPHLGRKAIEVRLDQMILDVLEMREPEVRDLIENLALVRNARRQHDIERGDAIGGDEQKALAEVVHIAYFSPASERKRQAGFENGATHGRAFYCVRNIPSPSLATESRTCRARLRSIFLPTDAGSLMPFLKSTLGVARSDGD